MRRRGFTLIEMIAVITASTALMGIAVCLLVLLMRAEGGGREHAQRQQSLVRLAEQFRRDVHAAIREPDIFADSRAAWGLPVSIDNLPHFAEYEVDGEYITRHEYIWARSNVTRSTRWETYALPKDCTARIETEPASDGRLIRLVIAPNDASKGGGREVRIEAILGRDHRFASRAEGSK